MDDRIGTLGLPQAGRHRGQQAERGQHVKFARDHGADVFALLPAHGWSDQDALLIGALNDLGSRHLRAFGQDLKQSYEIGVIDERPFLIHHFLVDLDIPGR